MMTIGFDTGLDSVAYAAVWHGRCVFCGTIPRSKARRVKGQVVREFTDDYVRRMRRVMLTARTYDAQVYVEQSYGALNLRTFKALSHVEAEIRYAALLAGVRVEFVAPSSWQSVMLQKTRPRALLERLSMKYARVFVRASRSRGNPDTVHEADALHIARFAHEKNNTRTDACPPTTPKSKRSRKR